MATRIGFQGFVTGTSVVLSSGGETGVTGSSGWGVSAQSGDHTAQLVARRGELQLAPEGINFEVVLNGFDNAGPAGGANTYDPRFHNIYYFWEFGDPGSSFTAPQNIATQHRNANKAYGPIASHTFATPGTYTVSVLVIEPSSGKTATATLDVSVGDADAFFAGNKTTFVDPEGLYADAPQGARQALNPLEAIIAQNGFNDHHRIMLRRDVDHDLIGDIPQLRAQYLNIWMCGAPGAGERPRLTCSGMANDSGILRDMTSLNDATKRTDIVFHDLRLLGLWDSKTETMGGPNAGLHVGGESFLSQRNPGYGTYVLFNNVHASGFNMVLGNLSTHGSGDNDSLNFVFNNTKITNWSNFGVFQDEQGFSAYTGTVIAQDPQALSGGAKSIGHNEHGPIRIQQGGRCVMHSCDFFSRNGWFENAHGIHSTQPCVRWNQEGNPSAKLNMQGCSAEGGTGVLSLKTQDDGYVPCINNMLVDKTVVVGNAFSGDLIDVNHGGLTLRNCLLVQPNVSRNLRGGQGTNAFVRLDERTGSADLINTPQRIYSNTLVNQMVDANDIDSDSSMTPFILTGQNGSAFANVVEENNLVHQPNLDVPDTPYAPVSTDVLFNAQYTDYRDRSVFNETVNFVADVPAGDSFTLPYSDFGTGLSAASFVADTGSDPRLAHQMSLISSRVDADFAFGASEVTITNQSGSTWSSAQDHSAILTRAQINIRAEYATPVDSIISAAPLPGSPAIGAALSGLRALDDFYGQERPEYPSIGAFEVSG